jgi:hypothetical protein
VNFAFLRLCLSIPSFLIAVHLSRSHTHMLRPPKVQDLNTANHFLVMQPTKQRIKHDTVPRLQICPTPLGWLNKHAELLKIQLRTYEVSTFWLWRSRHMTVDRSRRLLELRDDNKSRDILLFCSLLL